MDNRKMTQNHLILQNPGEPSRRGSIFYNEIFYKNYKNAIVFYLFSIHFICL